MIGKIENQAVLSGNIVKNSFLDDLRIKHCHFPWSCEITHGATWNFRWQPAIGSDHRWASPHRSPTGRTYVGEGGTCVGTSFGTLVPGSPVSSFPETPVAIWDSPNGNWLGTRIPWAHHFWPFSFDGSHILSFRWWNLFVQLNRLFPLPELQ